MSPPDYDRVDPDRGEAPDMWTIINEDGEPRTNRRLTDEADEVYA